MSLPPFIKEKNYKFPRRVDEEGNPIPQPRARGFIPNLARVGYRGDFGQTDLKMYQEEFLLGLQRQARREGKAAPSRVGLENIPQLEYEMNQVLTAMTLNYPPEEQIALRKKLKRKNVICSNRLRYSDARGYFGGIHAE